MQYTAEIELDGKTATGVRVPAEIVEALGGGNRPPVCVSVNGHSYRTTVARMRGEFKFPVSAAAREAAGVKAGDEVRVDIELDTAPRELTIPDALVRALDDAPDAKAVFSKLSYSQRKRHVLAVEGAKTDETRDRRIAKVLQELGAR